MRPLQNVYCGGRLSDEDGAKGSQPIRGKGFFLLIAANDLTKKNFFFCKDCTPPFHLCFSTGEDGQQAREGGKLREEKFRLDYVHTPPHGQNWFAMCYKIISRRILSWFPSGTVWRFSSVKSPIKFLCVRKLVIKKKTHRTYHQAQINKSLSCDMWYACVKWKLWRKTTTSHVSTVSIFPNASFSRK